VTPPAGFFVVFCKVSSGGLSAVEQLTIHIKKYVAKVILQRAKVKLAA